MMTEDGNSNGIVNIDLSGLSQPATTFVNRVFDVIGGYTEPGRIRRIAQANADAAVIEAKADIKISEIQRRGLMRLAREEGEKQLNMEGIAAKAIPHIEGDAKTENLEKDWLSHFFDRCRLTSDSDMQEIWARLLSGEANSPSKFSKRTVDILASLDKSDAIAFKKLCSACWYGNGPVLVLPTLSGADAQDTGATFSLINHFDSLGLLHYGKDTQEYVLTALPKTVELRYFGRRVRIEFNKEANNSLKMGVCLLTRAGSELAEICEPVLSESSMSVAMEYWRACGYVLSTPPNAKSEWEV